MEEIKSISGAYAQALKDGRESFNARFAQARRAQPRLDPQEFGDTLRTTVAAIVSATERARPERTAEVVNVLYDLSLDLLAREFIGPHSRYPHINAGWRELLPALGPHIAESPRAVAGSLTNALYNLSVTPGARPLEWLDSMRTLVPLCTGVPALLRAGGGGAWRAGLAHYRQGALALCRQLDAPLARAALGLHAAGLEPSLDTLLARLTADPWLRPMDAVMENPPHELKIVARAGAFRGFGGLFMTPPTVATAGEHFIARDGDTRWLLTADVFGATFHRAGDTPMATGSGAFQVDRSGRVTLGKASKVFAELADFSSAAGNDRTLAVTTSLSHAIYLVALA